MVRNPYRTPNSSLPIYSSSISPQQTWISWLISCLTCGLLTKRSTILRLTVLLFIFTLGLISYYFHLHFTHPTLLSESIPKVQGSYDLSRFKPDVLLNQLQHLTEPRAIPNSLRGKKDENKSLKEDNKKTTAFEDLTEKDPIAYNPNHFHRYREPLKKEKTDQEQKIEKKSIPIVVSQDKKKDDGEEKLSPTDAIKHIKENSAKLAAIHINSHNHTSPKLAGIALNLNRSHAHEEKKIEPIRISSHPDSPRITSTKDVSKEVVLPRVEKHPQQLPISQADTATKTVSSISPPVPAVEREKEKSDQKEGVAEAVSADSALKQKLLDKLKQMKNHHVTETTPTHDVQSSEVNKPKHITTTHDANSGVETKNDFKDIAKDVSTVQQPSTAYDLPHDLVDRLQAHNRSSPVSSNRNAGSNEREGEVAKEKVDYCENNIDPFEKIPVDRFVPPKGAPFESVTIWKKKINDFVKSVSKLKIGGEALREKLEEDVTQLKILRFKMFCKYA